MSFNYIFLYIVLVICSYTEYSTRKDYKQLYIIIVVFMALTAGFGYALSPDWVAYFNVFRSLPNVDWPDLPRFSELVSMEKGYLSVNKILSDIGFDFGFLALLLASISLLLKTSTFYKYGGFPFLVLFIYAMPNFLFEEHVHIRQGFANAITIYSIRYIIDRKLLKFLLCLTIAYQFHSSVIVFILAYWIAVLKFNEITIGWLVTIAIIGNYTGLTSIIEVIMQYMPFGQDKFEDYQSQLYTESGVALGDIIKILSVMSIIIYNKYASHDKLYCMFRNLFIMGVLLFFFLGKGIFGIRLPGFYLVFMGMTIGRMLYSFKGEVFKQNFIYYTFILYTVLLIFWFQIKQGHNSNFGNYRTFFTEGAAYGLWKN